jgi:hypothetical protein
MMSNETPSFLDALDDHQLYRLANVLNFPMSLTSASLSSLACWNLTSSVEILPSIQITPAAFCFCVRREIEAAGIEVEDICLEGSAAAYCISRQPTASFVCLPLACFC